MASAIVSGRAPFVIIMSILVLSPVFLQILVNIEGFLGGGSSTASFSSLMTCSVELELPWLGVLDDDTSSSMIDVRIREMGKDRSLMPEFSMVESLRSTSEIDQRSGSSGRKSYIRTLRSYISRLEVSSF